MTHMDEDTYEKALWCIKAVSLEDFETTVVHILWMAAPPNEESMSLEEWMPSLVQLFYDRNEAVMEVSCTEGNGLTEVMGVDE
jgi:hypothetical protein